MGLGQPGTHQPLGQTLPNSILILEARRLSEHCGQVGAEDPHGERGWRSQRKEGGGCLVRGASSGRGRGFLQEGGPVVWVRRWTLLGRGVGTL